MDRLQQRIIYAIARYKTAEYEEAKIIFKQLLKIYTRNKQNDKIHLCLFHLACIAYVRGEKNYFNVLFKDFERLQNEQPQAAYYLLRGLYTLQQQQYKLALEELSKAASLADDDDIISQKVLVLLSKAKCQHHLGSAEQALATIDKVYSNYAEQINADTSLFFQFHLNRSDILYTLGKIEETEVHLAACEAHIDFSILANERARTFAARAKNAIVKMDFNRALPFLQQALALCENFDEPLLQNEIYEALIGCCEMLGKHKQALTFTKKQLQLQKTSDKKRNE